MLDFTLTLSEVRPNIPPAIHLYCAAQDYGFHSTSKSTSMDIFHSIPHFQKCYDPNQRHVFYGADADLILLGLTTHEPNFYILREVSVDIMCYKCRKYGHNARECDAR